jgi:ubiquinone/menaquinone biosynthesis C-methylase UbiE
MKEASVREEILAAATEISRGNPWYVADQLETQVYGAYRHNMRLRYQYVRAQIRDTQIDGKKVVDLGCGDGQWSVELSRSHRPQLVGIDYNPLRLERYRQNVPHAEVRFGSCLEIPLDDNSADVVMFHQVLEHLSTPEVALREIHRILRPGGWLMLSVPNEGTWLKQQIQYRLIEPRALEQTDHVNFFTRPSLRALLEKNMYQVRKIDAIGFYFPHNGISRRLVKHRVSFEIGVRLAQLVPILRDCLFAWCQPILK